MRKMLINRAKPNIRQNIRKPCIRSFSSDIRKTDYVGVVVFSAISLGCIGLGIWQTQRYQWKINHMQDIEDNIKATPVEIPLFHNQMQCCEYIYQNKGKRISVTGKFDHSKEVMLGPRTAPLGLTGGPAQGLATNPQGFYVITPLKRSDGTVVFVNRGWVARTHTGWDRPNSEITIHGIPMGEEKGGAFVPENDIKGKKLLWLEVKSLFEAAQMKPDLQSFIYMEAVNTDDKNELPSFPYAKRVEELSQQYITPATHFVYALTWYSLGLAGLVMTYYNFRRPRRKFRRPPKL